MIPKDRLHCPLRTLSLAGPRLARRCVFSKRAVNSDSQQHGPKKLCYRNAPYIYRDPSAYCLLKAITFFAACSANFYRFCTRSFQALIPLTEARFARKGKNVLIFVTVLFALFWTLLLSWISRALDDWVAPRMGGSLLFIVLLNRRLGLVCSHSPSLSIDSSFIRER